MLGKVAKTGHQSEQARWTGPPWTPVFGPEKSVKNRGKTSRRVTSPVFCNGFVRFGVLVMLTGLGV